MSALRAPGIKPAFTFYNFSPVHGIINKEILCTRGLLFFEKGDKNYEWTNDII